MDKDKNLKIHVKAVASENLEINLDADEPEDMTNFIQSNKVDEIKDDKDSGTKPDGD